MSANDPKRTWLCALGRCVWRRISFRSLQKAFSRLTLVLCPLMTAHHTLSDLLFEIGFAVGDAPTKRRINFGPPPVHRIRSSERVESVRRRAASRWVSKGESIAGRWRVQAGDALGHRSLQRSIQNVLNVLSLLQCFYVAPNLLITKAPSRATFVPAPASVANFIIEWFPLNIAARNIAIPKHLFNHSNTVRCRHS
jgi:hypothetical protein